MTGSGRNSARQTPERREEIAGTVPRRARWRRSVTLLIAAVLAGLVSLVVQGTSHACSCMPLTPAEQIETSDVVFVGTPVEKQDVEGGVRWSVDVETVHKGEIGATTPLETAGDSAACGIAFTPGERYLVFATGTDRIGANLCSGTGPVDRADPEILALLGEGSPPNPDSATEPVDTRTATERNDAGSGPWPLIGGITAAVLIGGVVVLLLVRSRRRV